MSKRKRDDLYDFSLPVPKWPRQDEPEKWTFHDMESAMMINTLHLEPPEGTSKSTECHGLILPGKNNFIKVSRFIQALDLANFDDYEIVLDPDLQPYWVNLDAVFDPP